MGLEKYCSFLVIFLQASLVTSAHPHKNLTCYICAEKFKRIWDPNTNCQRRPTALPKQMCASVHRYCMVKRTTIKERVISFERNCAARCYFGCQAYGFGVPELICMSCCDTSGCNTGNGAEDSRKKLGSMKLQTFKLAILNIIAIRMSL